MNELPFIDGERLGTILEMPDAIGALERAFKRQLPASPDRSHLDVGTGDLLIMPAWGEAAMGVKLVTVAPGNADLGKPLIQGVYILFEKRSLSPVALFDGAALTALRTAAVSGLATSYLARVDSTELILFGAGTQARAHLDAMRAVRDIRTVKIVSRSPRPAEQLAQRASELGLEAEVTETAAISEADLICTCTTSSEPLFDGRLLRAGVHINAVGSYKPSARELDDATLRDSRIVVDTGVAMSESGDLSHPVGSGVIKQDEVEELAGVVAGDRRRSSTSERTVFKSVGAAFEDLIVAEAAFEQL